LPTTTATGGIPLSTHSPPNQRGAIPHHDCDPAAAGQHHVPSATEEQSRGHKTSSFQ